MFSACEGRDRPFDPRTIPRCVKTASAVPRADQLQLFGAAIHLGNISPARRFLAESTVFAPYAPLLRSVRFVTLSEPTVYPMAWTREHENQAVIEVEVEDDGRPYDPTALAPPDLSASLRDRPVGGLGMHFVRNLMSEVTYARAGDHNRLLLKKCLAHRSEEDEHGPS